MRQRRCLDSPDKVRYGSQHEVAAACRDAELGRRVRLFYYYCSWCDGWHLTSKTNSASL